MLLSSTLPCDGRAKPSLRLSSLPSFPAPPTTTTTATAGETTAPPSTPRAGAGTSLYSTCRALQSMLMTPSTPTSTPKPQSLPYRLASPIAFAARRIGAPAAPGQQTRPTFKIRKPANKTIQPPRGANKRRRSTDDDGSHRDEDPRPGSDRETSASENEREPSTFSTPKRARLLAPFDLPRGLARSDFDALEPICASHLNTIHSASSSHHHPDPPDPNEEWTTDDDRALVQLVLEKFKLSSDDWTECAKTLGKDMGTVGRRWKSLVGDGSVGIRGGGGLGAVGGRKSKLRRGRVGLDMRSTL